MIMNFCPIFPACHESCKSTCWEGGPKGCDECKSGWKASEEEGCVGKRYNYFLSFFLTFKRIHSFGKIKVKGLCQTLVKFRRISRKLGTYIIVQQFTHREHRQSDICVTSFIIFLMPDANIYIGIFIAIVLDEANILVAVHFLMKNIYVI